MYRGNQSIIFFVGAFMLAILFCLIHFVLGSIEAVLWVNGNHHPILDYLYKYATLFGEWQGVVVAVLIIVLLRKWKWLIPFALLNTLAGLLSYSLKRFVFSDFDRPRKVLNNDALIHFVQGVEVHFNLSYPSGHTLTMMAVACSMSIFFRNKRWIQLVLLVLLFLGGLSRVYLFQHFFIDVASSIFIGLFVNGILLFFYDQYVGDSLKITA